MHSNAVVARALSAAFLAGTLEIDGCVDRGAKLFGRRWRWLRPLARRVSDTFKNAARPRQIEVIKFLHSDKGFLRAIKEYELRLIDRLAGPPTMSPVAAAASWGVPEIRSPGELADWLGIAVSDLDWFADLRALEYKRNEGRLRHYHYRTMSKRFGQIRLIEAPKKRLKDIQRRILAAILDRIPPHASVHGFRRGRSVKTFASPHTGKQVVLRIDRIMRGGVRQQLAGVVVNEHINVIRADYDRLKATLTNCIQHGAQSQNRTNCQDFRAHLLGRIAFVDMLNPNRSSRLRALFDQIEW